MIARSPYARARVRGNRAIGVFPERVGWVQPTIADSLGGLSPPYVWFFAFVILASSILFASRARADDQAQSARIEKLNGAFLKHLEQHPPGDAIAVATIREGWKTTYKDAPESFVPDALAVLSPAYRDALAAFDAGESAAVVRLLAPLRSDANPFLAANAVYFHTRAQIDLGRFEEVETDLSAALADLEALDQHTPYAPHLAFLRGFVQARNLHFDQARTSLAATRERYPQAPEAVQSGLRQLLLELERRETGGLDEVATVMQYVADRLKTADAGERVHSRQGEVLTLLDKLIQEEEQKEKQQGGGGKAACKKPGKKDAKPDKPQKPREDSEAPAGAGEIGDLHAAPKVDPGEAWGKLPPTEREKILQSLRDRFPSRYRQLVEQYYRSLAEQK